LEPAKVDAINEALAGEVPLEVLSRRTAISKSALHRHKQHLDRFNPGQSPVVETTPVAPPAKRSVEVSLTSGTPAAPPKAPLNKSQLLERVDLLWTEAMEGLAETKKPIRLTKSGGEVVEVPGDLRSRCGFLRVASSIAELGGRASGELTNVGPGGVDMTRPIQVIIIPKQPGTPEFAPEEDYQLPGPGYSSPQVIDIEDEEEE